MTEWMKVSELIEWLQDVQLNHGDLPFYVCVELDGEVPFEVTSLYVREEFRNDGELIVPRRIVAELD